MKLKIRFASFKSKLKTYSRAVTEILMEVLKETQLSA